MALGRTFVHTDAEGCPGFVLAAAGRPGRFVIFDLSGRVRVNARRIPTASTVKAGDLIRVGAERFRMERGGAIAGDAEEDTVCSFCRDAIPKGEATVACTSCGRHQHTECSEAFGRCGRCMHALDGSDNG